MLNLVYSGSHFGFYHFLNVTKWKLAKEIVRSWHRELDLETLYHFEYYTYLS